MNYTAGGQFTFFIKVGNVGNATANNVTMTDTLPQGFTFSNCTNNNGIACNYNAGNNTLSSASFSLTQGQDTIFTVVGTLTNTIDTTNTASALLA